MKYDFFTKLKADFNESIYNADTYSKAFEGIEMTPDSYEKEKLKRVPGDNTITYNVFSRVKDDTETIVCFVIGKEGTSIYIDSVMYYYNDELYRVIIEYFENNSFRGILEYYDKDAVAYMDDQVGAKMMNFNPQDFGIIPDEVINVIIPDVDNLGESYNELKFFEFIKTCKDKTLEYKKQRGRKKKGI